MFSNGPGAEAVSIGLSILDDKAYTGKLFKDGVNAHRIARDYKAETIQVKKDDKMKLHLAPGGGFALVLK